MRKLSMTELQRPDAAAYAAQPKLPLVLVADNVRSMHNVGAFFRTADALNLQGLWLCGITATPPHRDIYKSALGAETTVPWQHAPVVVQAIQALPYLMTVVLLAGFIGRARAPAALGVPYLKER